MEFSIVYEAQLSNPTRQRERQLLLDCVDQAVAAERTNAAADAGVR